MKARPTGMGLRTPSQKRCPPPTPQAWAWRRRAGWRRRGCGRKGVAPEGGDETFYRWLGADDGDGSAPAGCQAPAPPSPLSPVPSVGNNPRHGGQEVRHNEPPQRCAAIPHAIAHRPHAGVNALACEGVVGVQGAFADGAQRAVLFTRVSSSLHRDSPYRRSCFTVGLRFLMGHSLLS
jgi:hypothetical protein